MALLDVDRSLLSRCLAREQGAWKEFVDRFAGLFVHVIQHTAHARSIPITPHDVDDLAADVFLALLANDSDILRRFRGDSSLNTYLTVICRRIVVHDSTNPLEWIKLTIDPNVNAVNGINAFGPFRWERIQPK